MVETIRKLEKNHSQYLNSNKVNEKIENININKQGINNTIDKNMKNNEIKKKNIIINNNNIQNSVSIVRTNNDVTEYNTTDKQSNTNNTDNNNKTIKSILKRKKHKNIKTEHTFKKTTKRYKIPPAMKIVKETVKENYENIKANTYHNHLNHITDKWQLNIGEFQTLQHQQFFFKKSLPKEIKEHVELLTLQKIHQEFRQCPFCKKKFNDNSFEHIMSCDKYSYIWVYLTKKLEFEDTSIVPAKLLVFGEKDKLFEFQKNIVLHYFIWKNRKITSVILMTNSILYDFNSFNFVFQPP